MKYPIDFTEELKNKGICGVLSTATIAGVPFASATNLYKKNLMPGRKRHGGATCHSQRCIVLSLLGVDFKEIKIYEKRTLNHVVLNYLNPEKTYMITTSSHVVTIKADIVQDQVEQCHISIHNSRRCFVKHILEII